MKKCVAEAMEAQRRANAFLHEELARIRKAVKGYLIANPQSELTAKVKADIIKALPDCNPNHIDTVLRQILRCYKNPANIPIVAKRKRDVFIEASKAIGAYLSAHPVLEMTEDIKGRIIRSLPYEPSVIRKVLDDMEANDNYRTAQHASRIEDRISRSKRRRM